MNPEKKKESNNRAAGEIELTTEQLEAVDGGSMDNTAYACALVAQAQAQGVVKVHSR
jgi:hypothetical protein